MPSGHYLATCSSLYKPAARVRGSRGVRVPGGIMKMVASTCPEQFSGQSLIFEPLESSLLAGLLICACLVQDV